MNSDNEEDSIYSNDSDSESDKEQKTKFKLGSSAKPLTSLNIDDDYDSSSDNSIEDLDNQVGGDVEDLVSEPEVDEDSEIEDDTEPEVDEELENDDDEGEKQTKTKGNKTKKPVQINLHTDDEDDEDDDDNLYLQKFDNEITKNYINEFHPECLIHNYDEISKLTVVIRDSNNIIIDPLHKTIPFLTKYEKARILGQRAKQIETGARPFVNVPENVIDSYVIAELELQQKRIPFIIRRPIPGGACEYWNLKDLEVIYF